VERGVTTFGPVCSSVAGMALHHLEGKRTVQEGTDLYRDELREALPGCYLVIAQQPCYGLRPR
jgi:hypothetical protein